MRHVIILVAACCMSKMAYGQSPPDYPRFSFEGLVGTTKYPARSDLFGALDANTRRFGEKPPAFTTLSFKTDEPGRLKLVYSCVFKRNDNEGIIDTPNYENGEMCPAQTTSSAAVRAFRIVLDGENKDRYVLEYSCEVGYFNQTNTTPFARRGADEWCGNKTGGAPDEWITRVTVYLHRR